MTVAVEALQVEPVAPAELSDEDARAALLGLPRERFVAYATDQRLGRAMLGASPYLPLAERDVGVEVERESRGHGVGDALLATVEAAAHTGSARALWASVRQNDAVALRWAGRRGFRQEACRLQGELDLRRLPPRRAAPAQFVLRRFTETGEDWPRLYVLFLGLLADAPDMRGVPAWTPWQAELALRRGGGGAAPGRILLAEDQDGDWVGMSAWRGRPGADRAYSYFTGVVPKVRGYGVALALKAAAAHDAREAGFVAMGLDNLASNAAMRAVNERLGVAWTARLCLLRKPLDRSSDARVGLA